MPLSPYKTDSDMEALVSIRITDKVVGDEVSAIMIIHIFVGRVVGKFLTLSSPLHYISPRTLRESVCW